MATGEFWQLASEPWQRSRRLARQLHWARVSDASRRRRGPARSELSRAGPIVRPPPSERPRGPLSEHCVATLELGTGQAEKKLSAFRAGPMQSLRQLFSLCCQRRP